MEDTLQTHPIEKRNANNLVGRARNDVTDKLPICLYFVIFNKPTHNETFVIASANRAPLQPKVYNCCHMLHIHPCGAR
jgi:hypothetical protein